MLNISAMCVGLKMRVLTFAILAACAFGQTKTESLRFDVISIKEPPQGRQSGARRGCTGDRFAFTGFALTWLIRWAYDLPPTRMVGLPDWVTDWVNKRDSMYEIEAKASTAVNNAQCKEMARSLLGDRFKMIAHLEPREIHVYSLTVAKRGPKMRQVTPGTAGAGVTMRGIPQRTQAEILAGMSMAQLAENLSVGAPVVDKTGLAGMYSFHLDWSMKEDDGLPSIFTAVEEQLGLKLEATKATMEVLVVSHMERPTAN